MHALHASGRKGYNFHTIFFVAFLRENAGCRGVFGGFSGTGSLDYLDFLFR